MNKILKGIACAGLFAGTITLGLAAQAAEVTISAVSAFADGTTFTKNFERFIAKVNETGKGVIQIDYKGGGGKVMNPFQLGDAIRTGVVGIGNLPGAFYTKLMPEADVFKLSAFTITEERNNGAWEYTNELHKKRMNVYHLARQKDCVPFHLYLSRKAKPITAADLTDSGNGSPYKIRVTPIYRAFFSDLGASMIRTKPGDVYTALERGTVDGYGWPTQGVLDLGWHEVTGQRVDPSFYRASVEVLINLDQWNKLGAAQKQVLQTAADFMEGLCSEDMQINEAEIKRQDAAGIKTITFSGPEGDAFRQRAYDTGWAEFIKANPEEGPKLKTLLSK